MDLHSKNIKTVSKVLPFYEPPPRKTSAEIINEARLAIRESQMADNSFVSTSIKPLQTQRPFTPREKERIFFGKNVKAKRPPSSFSLRYLQNETDLPHTPPESSPIITPNSLMNANRKTEFDKRKFKASCKEINENKIFNIGVKEQNFHKIKLPALDSVKLLERRKINKSAHSLDKLPEENEKGDDPRKTFSSPQERTEGNVSELLLGPQNLNKIFGNKRIVENSGTLFVGTGHFCKDSLRKRNEISKSFSVLEMCDSLKERTFDDVLEVLNSEKFRNDEQVTIDLLNELYECMEKEKMIDIQVGSKTKIQILKCLYKYVESQNEQLLLNIGKIILALKVTGTNLSGVCKLIFKVSKNDKNDHLFFQKNVLELFLDALGRSSPLEDAEACVYGYGSVKFLTMNPKLLKTISTLGILQLMVLHLKIVNNAKVEKIQLPQHTPHAIFQLTGALRNLISEETDFEAFLSNGTVSELCQTVDLFANDLDVVSNISRILSTVSMNDCCCDVIVEHKDVFKLFLKLFDRYIGHEEIVVRLAYTLGNIAAKLDNTRVKFYHEDKSIDTLMRLWRIYMERTLKNCSLKADGENSGNSEDVMIKVIRIIANIVINPEVGKAINEHFGMELITEILKVLISNPFKKNEELVLSILSTLNNVSYYYTSELDHDIFNMKQIDIAEGITEYAKCKNLECVTETMRILGNLSRSKVTRTYIAESEMFNVLVKLLSRSDLTLLRTTVGVFVNLMADNKSRLLFKSLGGISKLISVLSKYGQYDWTLSMLVCQVIWNYSIDTSDLYELLSDSEIQDLLTMLADFLDEEKLFGITEATADDSTLYTSQEYIVWEEFANVATNLLEKIEYFLDTFEQLELTESKETNTPKMKDCSTNISFAAW